MAETDSEKAKGGLWSWLRWTASIVWGTAVMGWMLYLLVWLFLFMTPRFIYTVWCNIPETGCYEERARQSR